MPVISPAILASDEQMYRTEMERLGRLATRVQIDLTDGIFAKSPTVKPEQAWWPVGVKADFHLMYDHPFPATKTILQHLAHLIIVHAESRGNFIEFSEFCHKAGVKVGVALLPATSPDKIIPALGYIDHVLIFSGDLGKYGGSADLTLLHKIKDLREAKADLEIGWDGGINDRNIKALVNGGVDVLNVGGYIQKSSNPQAAIRHLVEIASGRAV